jgi:hypothetical protein
MQIRVIAGDDVGNISSLQVVKMVPEVSWRVGIPTKVEALAIGDKDSRGKYSVRVAAMCTS